MTIPRELGLQKTGDKIPGDIPAGQGTGEDNRQSKNDPGY